MQSSTVQPPAGMEMPNPNDGVSVPHSNWKKSDNGAVHRILSGNRLHLQHGPIDLIIVVDGPEQVQNEAFDRAIHRFDPILEELVTELPILKTPWNPSFPNVKGRVAKRMLEAVQGLDVFITPMAAVAGAVADEIRDVMLEVPGIRRLMVNNGGDIAFGLTPGTECRFGVFELKEAFEISREDQQCGVIILTGKGEKAFCSGGDQSIRGDAGYIGDDGVPRLNILDVQKQIRYMPKPVIALSLIHI